MTSDATLDPWHMDSPLSSITTPSQDGDSPSHTDDRIFFGPLQSPEKRYAMPSGGRPFRTPVRRSTRLSTAMIPLPLFSDMVNSPPSNTREGTPEEDAIADEPSVILATRVLSACSNPSPPPTPPLLAREDVLEADDVRLLEALSTVHEDVETADSSVSQGILIPIEETSDPVMSSPLFVPHSSTNTPTPRQSSNQSSVFQPDLIDFGSFSTTPTPVQKEVQAATPTHPGDPSPIHSRLASVDELLSMSPNTTSASEVDARLNDVPTHKQEKELSATPVEEMEVIHSLVIDVDSASASPPLVEMLLPEDLTSQEPIATIPELPAGAAAETTPLLRRSNRPRRSRSSLPQTVVHVAPPPTTLKKSASEVILTDYVVDTSQTTESQQSPQRKRRLRLPQEPEDHGDANVAGAPTTPRRLPQVARVHRELGSLSPMSAAVLTQLLPKPGGSASGSSTPQPPPTEQDEAPAPQSVLPPAPSTPPLQSTAFVFPKVGPSDTETDVSRPKSPLRPYSPPKFAEGSRTPARRVPIAQAIADGTYSTQKLPAAFGNVARPPTQPGSPVFRKLALNDPARSPAKRVPIADARPVPPPSPYKPLDKGKAVYRSQSPVRGLSVPPRERQRSGSAEPQTLLGRKERGMSAEPAVQRPSLGRRPFFQKPASVDGSTPSSSSKPRTTLPYPLAQRIPTSIFEAEEPGPSAARPTAKEPVRSLASPQKAGSSLRQPSAGASSKIPRIGAKPYARPKGADAAPSKLPTPAKSRIITKAKPLRIVTVGSSSGSSSDEGHGSSNLTAKPPQLTLKPRRVVSVQSSSSSSIAANDGGSGNGVKRKREPDPPKPPPMLVMRKVVPGMFNKGKEVAPAQTSQPIAPPIVPPSPAKPIRARSAVGWKRPQPVGHVEPPRTQVSSDTETVKEEAPSNPKPAQTTPAPTCVERSPAKETREPTPPPAPAPPEPPKESSIPVPVSAPAPTTVTHAEPHAASTTRRSTRAKRSSTPSSDVFGSVLPTHSSRPLQRRRGPLPSETAGPFAGMSALALKTLTSANTLKNQQQVITIQTEIVRKEGARPESPTTRVRSALEKQKEERVQQRQERAARRARRSAGSDTDPFALTPAGADGEGDDVGDASFMSEDQDSDGPAARHRRGPGDEEDYETPPRPERPAKRGRFEGSDGSDKERSMDVEEKRVKWDRGLHTTVYLPDTPPKPKWNTKAVPSQKSCLTPAAKALRLDTLGNVLNAEVPLGGLIKEQIVVKKFVFDDDEAQAAAEPVPAPAPAKSTRSRSKKAKS